MSDNYVPSVRSADNSGEPPEPTQPSESTVAPPPVPAPPPLPPPPEHAPTPPEHTPTQQPRPGGDNTPPSGWPAKAQAAPNQTAMHAPAQQFDMPTVRQAPRAKAAPQAEPVPAPPPVASAEMRRRHAAAAEQSQNAPQAYQSQLPATRSERASESMSHVQVRSMAKLPPEKGWRRWLLFLTRINLGLSPDEIYERDLHAKIRKIVRDPHSTTRNSSYQVAVMSVKGGVGKTVLAVLLGSVMSKVRANPVLAIDADPDAGNLVDRARKESEYSIAQLVAAGRDLNSYNSVRAHTSMNEANLEVLAAADYVDARRAFNGDDWRVATEVVSPFYPIIVADSGTGLFGDAPQAILESVWGLVVVSDTAIDGAKKAGETLDWIRVHGYPDLISRTVVIINHTKRGRESVDLTEVKSRFASIVGEEHVFEIPFDDHIDQGTEINLRLIDRTVLRRITEVAASLSENFDRPRRGVPTPQ